jgi:hypothetical protein
MWIPSAITASPAQCSLWTPRPRSQLLRLPGTQPCPRSYHTAQKIVQSEHLVPLRQKFEANHQTTRILLFKNKQ